MKQRLDNADVLAVSTVILVSVSSWFAGYYSDGSFLLGVVPTFWTLLTIVGVYFGE